MKNMKWLIAEIKNPLVILWMLVICLLIMCGKPSIAKTRENVYRVEVRVTVNNCREIVTVLVEASSSYSAQNQAERLAKYQIKTSVKSCREVK